MAIVTDIITRAKVLLNDNLTTFSQLDYEHNIELNSERGIENRYGFIPLDSEFVFGRAQQFATIDHRFQLVLTTDFSNQDDDTAQSVAELDLIDKAYTMLKIFSQDKFSGNALVVNGISLEQPEFLNENKIVAVRLNMNIQYRFQIT